MLQVRIYIDHVTRWYTLIRLHQNVFLISSTSSLSWIIETLVPVLEVVEDVLVLSLAFVVGGQTRMQIKSFRTEIRKLKIQDDEDVNVLRRPALRNTSGSCLEPIEWPTIYRVNSPIDSSRIVPPFVHSGLVRSVNPFKSFQWSYSTSDVHSFWWFYWRVRWSWKVWNLR